MGTHPIFESDFDCLTDHEMSQASINLGKGKAQTGSTSMSSRPSTQRLHIDKSPITCVPNKQFQVQNKFSETTQDVEFEARVLVKTEVELVDVNLEADCICLGK